MNWLVILVLLFLAAYIIRGYHNGFIKTVFSICAVFIAIVVASLGNNVLSGILQDNKTIYETINNKVTETMQIDTEAKTASEQQSYIDSLPVPQKIKDALGENNNNKIYELMDANKFEDYISGYLTGVILKAISFVLLFVVTLILVRVLASALDIVSKLPVLNSINKLGGVAVGLLHGLVVLWVLCVVLTIYSGTGIGEKCFEAINDSVFLSIIYNNNLLLYFVVNVAQMLAIVK